MSHEDSENLELSGVEQLCSEPRGFAPEQMVRCEACLRANPPTRMSCLYCAAPLAVTEASAALRQPTLRRLEKWERGVNCILIPGETANINEATLAEAASLLRLDPEALQRIIAAREFLPLARAATLDEASLIEQRLGALGMKVLIVSDQDLGLESSLPKRLRGVEFTADALVALPTGSGESLRVLWTEISLLVAGRLLVRSVEVEERRKRNRAENEIINASEFSADEAVLDIYTAQRHGGWRIAAGNFDFSCLGSKKRLVATENFSALRDVLSERAGAGAAYDDSYQRVRHALAAVWPLEQHSASRGWRRERFGSYKTEAVTKSDNETQFTRYSRLRHYLRLRQLDSPV